MVNVLMVLELIWDLSEILKVTIIKMIRYFEKVYKFVLKYLPNYSKLHHLIFLVSS